MLKNIFKNKEKNTKNKEKLLNRSLMDGYVDIKVFRNTGDNEKKLIYHDTGDNVVTNWMRHSILLLLTGSNFSAVGKTSGSFTDSSASESSSEAISKPYTNDSDIVVHSDSSNLDGYVLDNSAYFWEQDDYNDKYSKSLVSTNNIFAWFPTKVLFGTGSEYNDFDTFKTEKESTDKDYYENIVSAYGSEDKLKAAFDTANEMGCNTFSGTTASNSISGNNSLQTGMISFNNSQTTILTTSNSEFSEAYNVMGAIKTSYFSSSDDKLEKIDSDSGRLLLPGYRGMGRPCFIYFNGYTEGEEGWNSSSNDAQVVLSKDSDGNYLSRITFKVIMPSQNSGVYYPYNGYTLNQVGLYNDSKMADEPSGTSTINNYPYNNMAWGTLLAIKNITPFTKTASDTIEFTWALTV